MMIPTFTDLKTWAASLLIDFPREDIPVLSNQDWKEWGDELVQTDAFNKEGAPGTHFYSDWKKWAEAVFYTMANY